ncbi:MAG: riboflavin synthase [Pseudobdellovibrionaceae bacterium]
MFSGIVEAVSEIQKAQAHDQVIRIWVARPSSFDDLKTGDSVSTNGVCLTVESLTDSEVVFALAPETLKVLGLNHSQTEALVGSPLNLERSLRFGDRIHGHIVSGHVEGQGQILQSEALGESWVLKVSLPKELRKYVWKKGSIGLHGVSLTVNEVDEASFSVCLIPETIKRTNLAALPVGSALNLEPDYMAKAVQHAIEMRGLT